jgi:hypothetical protein
MTRFVPNIFLTALKKKNVSGCTSLKKRVEKIKNSMAARWEEKKCLVQILNPSKVDPYPFNRMDQFNKRVWINSILRVWIDSRRH